MGAYYPATSSPRPNRPSYDPRAVRPQYTPPYYAPTSTSGRPLPSTPMYQQQQQQRPTMPFPGSPYPQQQQQTTQRPIYSNQPRPMYRPSSMQRPPVNNGGSYYRPPPPPQGIYPNQSRSPTLDHQRAAYGYPVNGGVSRSSTQNSSHGRYS
ncbi:hypothetical protein BC941DRAFT_419313 [Chlamydoabsidia padenii]|nr:hypothetical protein BC941DRAFT_419313 [Chlamydoabsidia padenii]